MNRTAGLVALLFEHNDRARERALARVREAKPVTWHDLVDSMPREEQDDLLKRVLRWRRRFVAMGINMQTWAVRRNDLRDYLKQRFLPFFMRNRPMPENAGEFIHFRRPRLSPRAE
jgi:hypothetical protein